MAHISPASVLDRLKNVSKERGINMQAILRRYAQERLLYRMSVSPYADNFCIKGGVLLSAYNDGNLLRPSEDIDFNGFFASGDIALVGKILREIISNGEIHDGAVFHLDSMRVDKDRGGKIPGGKISLLCYIDKARVEVRVDVGFGNAITPKVNRILMPTLLDTWIPRPEFNAYPLETVISEKSHAVFTYGLANSRLKDFYDLSIISQMHEFSGQILCDALVNTFTAHEDPIPINPWPGLSNEFAEDKRSAWKAFLKKIESKQITEFEAVVTDVRDFLHPIIVSAASDQLFPMDWNPANKWAPATPAFRI